MVAVLLLCFVVIYYVFVIKHDTNFPSNEKNIYTKSASQSKESDSIHRNATSESSHSNIYDKDPEKEGSCDKNFIGKSETEHIVLDEKQQEVLDFVSSGIKRLLVLGSAGTGKSTIIRKIKEKLETQNKNVMLMAPTGIAAINIGGTTIHSQLEISTAVAPAKVLIHSFQLQALLERTDTIIIDEVSMLRSDLMDAILKRIYNYNPQIQLILVGDLMQLPPVLSSKDIMPFIKAGYDSKIPYFIDSIRKESFKVCILDSYHRHVPGLFLDCLNHIRNGEKLAQVIEIFNNYCYVRKTDRQPFIFLNTTNKMADSINEFRLNAINSQLVICKAKIERYIETAKTNIANEFPSPLLLKIKVGAQVMITKNIYLNPLSKDDIVPNGALAIITDIKPFSIEVKLITVKPNSKLILYPVTWNKKRYVINPITKELNQVTEVSFTQYPIKLAWAITIHKSQGLTLQNYAIDLGINQFTDNLAYVAFSRGKSFEDITLLRPLKIEDIKYNQKMIDFIACMEKNKNTMKQNEQNSSINYENNYLKLS